ncbi:MBL fold metallo-hydrolase [Embleya sp. AB8]|uniref:MBL fold metallo-hydrolase n=1 Tax=Embleya sp. AB8 TaxID=3156304 RepID=UPI003C7352D9
MSRAGAGAEAGAHGIGIGIGIEVEIGGHATVLLRAAGFTLLCDPHFGDAYRGGLLGFAPARRVAPGRMARPDAVWISHSHRDHFDIASLDLLDRALPVFHPDDPRIGHTLRRLGFTRTTVVRDWTTLTPRPGLELIWTPSTLAVPEHGLAVRTMDTFVWHLVDSLVTDVWVDRLLGAGRGPDVLLAPAQPVLETRGVDGVPPGADADWADALTTLLGRARPAYVVPLPEGQFGLGDAAWLNGHAFPITPAEVDEVLRRDDPGRRVLRPNPGDRLTVGPGPVVWTLAGAATWVRATGEGRDRGFRPGHGIGPLVSALPSPHVANAVDAADAGNPVDVRNAVSAVAGLERLIDGPDGLRGPLPGLAELAAGFAGRLRDTSYRFVVVDADGAIAAERAVRLRPDGTLGPEPPTQAPDIEVAVTAADLADLLAARLGYSAAQYGGRLREIRPGPAADPEPGPIVVAGRHDRPVAHRPVLLSGIGLFALLLRARLGGPLAEFDAEIDACAERRPLRPVAAARAAAVPPTPDVRRPEHPGPAVVWARIADRLAHGQDPAGASGPLSEHEPGSYVGVLGRDPWPRPAPPPPGATGLLVLTCLVEAQPHLGGGVRFPADSYRALLANLMASPIRRWRPMATLPAGISVPRWRAAALFPVSVQRLRRDLARRGWDGELLDPIPESPPESGRTPPPPERHWWLGVPPPTGPEHPPRTLDVVESPGCRLAGLLHAAGPGPERTYAAPLVPTHTPDPDRERPRFEPDFLLWVGASTPAVEPGAARFPLGLLLRGEVRFSWLLSPTRTVARAERPVDAVAFAERVALLALAGLGRSTDPARSRARLRPPLVRAARRSPGE